LLKNVGSCRSAYAWPAEFLGTKPSLKLVREAASGLRGDNDYALGEAGRDGEGRRVSSHRLFVRLQQII
jgi:hypothetical protein